MLARSACGAPQWLAAATELLLNLRARQAPLHVHNHTDLVLQRLLVSNGAGATELVRSLVAAGALRLRDSFAEPMLRCWFACRAEVAAEQWHTAQTTQVVPRLVGSNSTANADADADVGLMECYATTLGQYMHTMGLDTARQQRLAAFPMKAPVPGAWHQWLTLTTTLPPRAYCWSHKGRMLMARHLGAHHAPRPPHAQRHTDAFLACGGGLFEEEWSLPMPADLAVVEVVTEDAQQLSALVDVAQQQPPCTTNFLWWNPVQRKCGGRMPRSSWAKLPSELRSGAHCVETADKAGMLWQQADEDTSAQLAKAVQEAGPGAAQVVMVPRGYDGAKTRHFTLFM